MSRKTPLLSWAIPAIAFCTLTYTGISVSAAEPAVAAAEITSVPLRMAPYVAISAVVKVSAADETAENAGWRQVLADAMTRGTKSLGDKNLGRVAEAAGGTMNVRVFEDAIVFTVAGDSARQRQLAELLKDVLFNPRLSEEDFVAARRKMLRDLGNSDQSSILERSPATEMLQRQLYRHEDKPVAYGLPSGGTVDSLAKITDENLRKLHQQYFNTGHLLFSASGDVDDEGLQQIFAQIPSAKSDSKKAPEYESLGNSNVVRTVKMPANAPWVLLGYRISSQISNEDLAALRVLSAALTETSPSLLSKVLLDQSKPQAMSISGQFIIRQYGSELRIAAQAGDSQKISSKDGVLGAIQKQIDEIKKTELSADQLRAAIALSEGDWAVPMDSRVNYSILMGYAAARNLPTSDWAKLLRSVSAADVRDAANKYLTDSAAVVVVPQSP